MAMQYLWRRDIVSRTSKTWGFYTKKMLSIASVSSYTGARSSQYPLSIPCWQFFLFIKLHRIIKLRPCVPPLNKLCQILQMCKVQLRRPEAGVILLASVKQCHCTHKNFISSKWNLNLLAKRYTGGQKKDVFFQQQVTFVKLRAVETIRDAIEWLTGLPAGAKKLT